MDFSMFHQTVKTLADEQCLRLVGLLGDGESSLAALAEQLESSTALTAQYVAKLRLAGLVNMRQAGDSQVYMLDQRTLKQFKLAVTHLEKTARPLPKSAGEWIDQLPIEAWEKKVMQDHFVGQRLREIPEKEHKLLVILNWLATRFEPEHTYRESEVNAVLMSYHADYASLRRGLISFGFLQRSRDGRQYWVTPAEEDPMTEDGGLRGERLREAQITPLLRAALARSLDS